MFYEGEESGCVAMATGSSAGLWDILNCEETNTFLCKQLVEGVTPPPPPPTTSPLLFCPEEWQSVSQSSFCFKVGISFLNANFSHLNRNIFCSCMEGGFYPAYLTYSLWQHGCSHPQGVWLGNVGKSCVNGTEDWSHRNSEPIGKVLIKFERQPQVDWLNNSIVSNRMRPNDQKKDRSLYLCF